MTDGTQVQVDAPAPPATPAEAVTRLDQLKATPAWRDGFLAGKPEHLQEYGKLHALIEKGNDIDVALSGVLPDVASESLKELSGTAEMLRGVGFTPMSIRETLEGREATQAEVDMAAAWKQKAMNSKEFTDRLLAGDPEAKKEWTAANVVLTLPIKKEKA